MNKLSKIFNKSFDLFYKTFLIISLFYVIAASLIFLIKICCSNSFVLLGTSTICEQKEMSYTETFSCQYFKVEENYEYYKVTIGSLEWKFNKEYTFDKYIWMNLLYIAEHNNAKVATTREIKKAFNLSCNSDIVAKNHVSYRKHGESLVGVAQKEKSNRYLLTLKEKALEILINNDIQMPLIDLQKKLWEIGYDERTTIEKIQTALSSVDFNTVRKKISELNNHCNHDQTESNIISVTNIDSQYRVKWGNVHWDIEKDNIFGLKSLLYNMYQARDESNQKIVGLRELGRILNCAHQDIDKDFTRYKNVMKRFKKLRKVSDPCEQYKEIKDVILKEWLENITLSGKEISKKIKEKYDEEIPVYKIQEIVSEVDFLKIRKQIISDYRQGKYQKSTKWVMKQYQNRIDKLLQQSIQAKLCSKATVEKFISDLPSTLPKEEIYKQTKEKSLSMKAWLKCFLFNLPKSLDGKVCCKECGSFDTAIKSRIPQTQIINDPKTSKIIHINTFRFYCKNKNCSISSFSATPDGSHILHEHQYAQTCTILRLVMHLGGSYGAVAKILGISRSTVFDKLTEISHMCNHWQEILGVISFSGTLCIDEKFLRIVDLKTTKGRRNFAYLFFAVDPLTYDLIHIEIYPSRNIQSVEAFLYDLKIQGVFPQVIMTDLFSGYDSAIRNVFGRFVTIAKCHFHFKKNIYKHMDEAFGKKNITQLATQLKEDIFFVVDHKSKKTIRLWLDQLNKSKPEYLRREPQLQPMFTCLENYIPHLLSVVENPNVNISTNNPAEQVIRHFNQRYKIMRSFKSLDTARRHAKLFHLVYRFTPLSEDAEKEKRGRTPLQLAGYNIQDMPIFHYLSQPLLFNLKPAQNLASYMKNSA
ncbi:transposase [Myxococcota bacterium]|nr:transposase [Myxococcota bacterium]